MYPFETQIIESLLEFACLQMKGMPTEIRCHFKTKFSFFSSHFIKENNTEENEI